MNMRKPLILFTTTLAIFLIFIVILYPVLWHKESIGKQTIQQSKIIDITNKDIIEHTISIQDESRQESRIETWLNSQTGQMKSIETINNKSSNMRNSTLVESSIVLGDGYLYVWTIHDGKLERAFKVHEGKHQYSLFTPFDPNLGDGTTAMKIGSTFFNGIPVVAYSTNSSGNGDSSTFYVDSKYQLLLEQESYDPIIHSKTKLDWQYNYIHNADSNLFSLPKNIFFKELRIPYDNNGKSK